MDVQALGLLVDIIDAGNLSKAASMLGMSRANVSQRINRFERELGAQLLRRTTRQLEPTEIGLKLYEHGRAMRHEVKAASEAVSSLGKELQGMVRLSVPSGYGQLRMSGWLAEFMLRHPEITLHVIFDNDIEELVKGSVDFAVRVMAEPPAHLVARELGRVRYVACATASFIAQHGLPSRLEDLKRLPLITSPQTGERLRTAGEQAGGHRSLRIRPRLVSANFHFLRDAIAQGLGVGLVPDYMVQAPLDGGEMRALPLEEGALDFLSTRKLLLYVPSRYQTLAVRTLIDFLVEKERAAPLR
jgi:DNA-binding transcriptional LysR family regulator